MHFIASKESLSRDLSRVLYTARGGGRKRWSHKLEYSVYMYAVKRPLSQNNCSIINIGEKKRAGGER